MARRLAPERSRKIVIERLAGDFRGSTAIVDDPWRDPGPGEVAVRNRHAGVNAVFDKNLCRNTIRYVDVVMVIETNYPLMVLGEIERIQGNYNSAMDYYRRSLTKLSQSGVQINLPGLLEAMAKLALAQGSHENAAWLFGVTQTAREKLKIPVPPLDLPDYQRQFAIFESRAGDEKIASAIKAGRALSLEQAIRKQL